MQGMVLTPHFRGPMKYRIDCGRVIASSIASATAHRLRYGPAMPGWNWTVEVGTLIIRNLIALITLAANTSTFAVDYRLTPEHPFPAALDDARAAYRWLLKRGTPPGQIVIAGDSAGGNLTLSLLCDLRDRGLPLPALGIGLSPATEFDNIRPSMTANEH